MDELTSARLSRDIKKLWEKHTSEGLVDPMVSLTEIAVRYGIDVDAALKLALASAPSPQQQEMK
jgi:hypothetical protein